MSSSYLKIFTIFLSFLFLYVLFQIYSSSDNSFLPAEESLMHEFHNWMKKFNRTYSSKLEHDLRFEIFTKNHKRVQTHNSLNNHSFFLTLNNFADLNPKEAGQKYAKSHYHDETFEPQVMQLDTFSLPASVDWRTKNAVSKIKDQGHCGACWAFGTIVSLEGLNAIKTNHLTEFSVQQLIDCSHNGPNSGCAGGDPVSAFDYIRLVGIEKESIYSFNESENKCQSNLSQTHYQIKGFIQVKPNDSDQLAAAVARQPVTICIDGDNPDFLTYGGGIFNSSSCTTNLGHCLAIVGYGSEKGVDYWIIKNSYGEDWGEKGYGRMIKQNGKGPGICGITLEAIYPVSL